jgi:hypothetical protein
MVAFGISIVANVVGAHQEQMQSSGGEKERTLGFEIIEM